MSVITHISETEVGDTTEEAAKALVELSQTSEESLPYRERQPCTESVCSSPPASPQYDSDIMERWKDYTGSPDNEGLNCSLGPSSPDGERLLVEF
jgi:hypothetical protein